MCWRKLSQVFYLLSIRLRMLNILPKVTQLIKLQSQDLNETKSSDHMVSWSCCVKLLLSINAVKTLRSNHAAWFSQSCDFKFVSFWGSFGFWEVGHAGVPCDLLSVSVSDLLYVENYICLYIRKAWDLQYSTGDLTSALKLPLWAPVRWEFNLAFCCA